MRYVAYSKIATNIIIMAGVIFIVQSKEDVHLAALVYSISSLLVSVFFLGLLSKVYNGFKFSINLEILKPLIKASYPLAISAFMITIYYSLDLIMLSYIKTDFEVGIYSAAYKVLMVAIIPFSLIMYSFLPSLSRVLTQSMDYFVNVMRSYAILLIGSGVVLGGLMFLFADGIIDLIFGAEYKSAYYPMLILSMNVIVIAINVLFGNPLTVWDKQKSYTIAVTLGAVTNIILNFILIPKYSYSGAAFATLLSEVVVFVGVFIVFNNFVRKISR